MKFSIFLLLASVIAVTVFGFATMDYAEAAAHRGCIDAATVSIGCSSPIVDTLAGPFRTFGALSSFIPTPSLSIFSPQAQQRARWLSLHENSPAFS